MRPSLLLCHPSSLPPSLSLSDSANVFTGRWSRWWILKQITLIIVFHNCQLCEGCQCAQRLFVCQYVLLQAPHPHPCPTPHNHQGYAYCLQPLNYSIRRTRLRMTPLLQLIRGTWLRKLFLLYIETYTSGSAAYCNLCPTELMCRWQTEKPTDCQAYWHTCGCVWVPPCSSIAPETHAQPQTNTLPYHSIMHNSGFAKEFNKWL